MNHKPVSPDWYGRIRAAFQSFLTSDDLKTTILSSTQAHLNGSGYSVELFPDGHFRVLWNGHIGNQYRSPGLLVALPAIRDDDWNDDPALIDFDNAIEDLKNHFADALQEQEVETGGGFDE